MNPEAPDNEPGAASDATAQTTSRTTIAIGFAVGAACWFGVLIPMPDYRQLMPLLFDCFVLPPLAVVLSLIPYTRRFGLGLLLAAAGGWLVLGAICGSAR